MEAGGGAAGAECLMIVSGRGHFSRAEAPVRN